MSNTAADTAHGRNSFKDRALARDFEPAFKLALAHKDLRLAGELAGSLGASNLIGSMAHQILTMGMGKGLGNEDQTASIKVAEEIAGVEVRRSDDTA